jgi:large subunit ribosomal protein L21
MYAVVRSGSKQYRVEPGQRVRVERLAGAVGDAVELGEVLLIGGDDGEPRVGQPLVSGARALGKIVDQGRAAKVMLFKMKRRKNYRRKQGHRQAYTEILVDRIEG